MSTVIPAMPRCENLTGRFQGVSTRIGVDLRSKKAQDVAKAQFEKEGCCIKDMTADAFGHGRLDLN